MNINYRSMEHPSSKEHTLIIVERKGREYFTTWAGKPSQKEIEASFKEPRWMRYYQPYYGR